MAPWLHLEKAGSTKICLLHLYGIMACFVLGSTGTNVFQISDNIYISLSRLRDAALTTVDATSKRYVITNPPFDFGLLPTDQVRMGTCWQTREVFSHHQTSEIQMLEATRI
jgi:hypothetical protein